MNQPLLLLLTSIAALTALVVFQSALNAPALLPFRGRGSKVPAHNRDQCGQQ
jgi:hypothetical protein